MSRLTQKPYGLDIHWSNTFYFYDAFDEVHNFPAVLTFNKFKFKSPTTRTVNILTPALQLCWDIIQVPVLSMDNFTRTFRHYVPKQWFENWLNENCPGWSMQPFIPFYDDTEFSLFFARKKDAVAASDYIIASLKGIQKTV
jgi:hypothetical protein